MSVVQIILLAHFLTPRICVNLVVVKRIAHSRSLKCLEFVVLAAETKRWVNRVVGFGASKFVERSQNWRSCGESWLVLSRMLIYRLNVKLLFLGVWRKSQKFHNTIIDSLLRVQYCYVEVKLRFQYCFIILSSFLLKNFNIEIIIQKIQKINFYFIGEALQQ